MQEALVKALQQWPFHGVPANPGGWLFRVARNAALDTFRKRGVFREKAAAIAAELQRALPVNLEETALDLAFQDDELRMVFLCCHPQLSRDASVALALKTVGGFNVGEIARAFLVEEAAVAQRLVRAKRQLRQGGARVELPPASELCGRIDAVLEVIYLMFNEGYKAHGGERLIRAELCREALRLGRMLATHPATGLPRVHALVALLAFQAARLPARVGATGDLILLEEQDRALWDGELIALGFRHLELSAEGAALTEYHLQAAIAAVHSSAAITGAIDWSEILSLYDQLLALNPSPVVALNRAVALARVKGPAAGLHALTALEGNRSLRDYYFLPSVQGQLWAELGHPERAAAYFRRALSLP
jgi:RNA polymerase sigma-70 factor (ECF subfamily)